MENATNIHGVIGATLLGGSIVLSGGGYALFLALSRLPGLSTHKRWLNIASNVFYSILLACVVALAIVLNLSGWWLGLVAAGWLFLSPKIYLETHKGGTRA